MRDRIHSCTSFQNRTSSENERVWQRLQKCVGSPLRLIRLVEMKGPSCVRLLVAVACVAIAGLNASGDEPTSKRPPNIVFVLADDLGRSELGCYGNGFNETPHLDQVAREGVLFTDAYASAPVCSPYRAALMTGQHPARLGIIDYLRPDSSNSLSTDLQTLPRALAKRGYSTGMVGKWHLSGYAYHQARREVRPVDIGFDWNLGSEIKGVGNGANFWPYVFREQPVRWLDFKEHRLGEDEYLTDRLNFEAVEFIERHQDQPFFLYLSHYAPHSILNGKPQLVDAFRRKHAPGPSSRTRCYLCKDHGHAGDKLNHWASEHNPHLAAMLKSIDEGVGLISKKLEELGIADNTILVFTSDNGGETNVTSNTPFRGGKSQLYEGGIRVPLIVRWPGQIPAGKTDEQPTSNVDFYPTFLEAAGASPDPDQALDGKSLLSAWTEPGQVSQPTDLYWHYPLDRPHFLGGVSAGAIRSGRWKLIEKFDSKLTELYAIDEDPGEESNVAEQNPDVTRDLALKLDRWRHNVGATIPSPPILVKPGRLSFADYFTPGQISDRWFFNGDWSVEDNVLSRGARGQGTTRIFLKETKFRDAMVRFDFQFRDAQELRLVTGSRGHYNAVIHLHRDHFFVQTASDPEAPYFSYRHGECAFQFDPDRWYSMTVEFIGDKLVAHVDQQHIAFAQHPILDRERDYFAFQVDQSAAAFDDVQIFEAEESQDFNHRLESVQDSVGHYPVKKSLDEQWKIQKANAHEWLYQHDVQYRKLVVRVKELDAARVLQFPEVFRSSKELQKAIQKQREKLLAEDPQFKEKLFATYRAKRAMDAYLIEQSPGISELPDHQRKRQMEIFRRKHRKDDAYMKLEGVFATLQTELEQSYSQLFVTNEEIRARQKRERDRLSEEPEFTRVIRERAEAYRASQDYLLNHDQQLKELTQLRQPAGVKAGERESKPVRP